MGLLAAAVSGPLPTHDWQFWVATICALAAAGWLVRRLYRSLTSHRRADSKRVELTLDRKAVPYGSQSRPDDQ